MFFKGWRIIGLLNNTFLHEKDEYESLSLSFKLIACPLFFQGIEVLKELF